LRWFGVSGSVVVLCWTISFGFFTEPLHQKAGSIAIGIVSLTRLRGPAFFAVVLLIALFLVPSLALALAGARLLARYRIHRSGITSLPGQASSGNSRVTRRAAHNA
jgi:hypothetical protein